MSEQPLPRPPPHSSHVTHALDVTAIVQIYKRRESKIISQVASVFTGAYVFHWSEFFPHDPLPRPPVFDARAVL